MPEQALVSLGSNIAPETNLPAAIAALQSRPDIRVLAVSPTYVSLPVGGANPQPLFHNAAMLIETALSPAALRQALREIEVSMGRVRSEDKYAARTIDLDLAMMGSQVLEVDGRHIPDPDIALHPHLALPLADIAPDWFHPELGRTLRQIADSMTYSAHEIRRLD